MLDFNTCNSLTIKLKIFFSFLFNFIFWLVFKNSIFLIFYYNKYFLINLTFLFKNKFKKEYLSKKIRYLNLYVAH